MAALDVYFDYRSPYADLAQTHVRKLGVDIDRFDFIRTSLGVAP